MSNFGGVMAGFVTGMNKADKEAATIERDRRKELQRKELEEFKKWEKRQQTVRGMFTGTTTEEVATGQVTEGSNVYPESVKLEKEKNTSMNGLDITRYNIPSAKHGTNTKVNKIITHRTSGGDFQSKAARLNEEGLGAHFTINYDGSVHQVGEETDKMWHSGPKGNPNSIGIEVVGRHLGAKKGWETMTDKQVNTLGVLSNYLVKKYGIDSESIIPHADIAAKQPTEGYTVRDAILAAVY